MIKELLLVQGTGDGNQDSWGILSQGPSSYALCHRMPRKERREEE